MISLLVFKRWTYPEQRYYSYLSRPGGICWTQRNTLEHTASHCSTLQVLIFVAASAQLQRTATNWNTLKHTATHCNTLQHAATQCNTPQVLIFVTASAQHNATHYNALQHTATCCITQQHTTSKNEFHGIQSKQCNAQQHTASNHARRSICSTKCKTLQHTTTHLNTQLSTTTHYKS